ncbi:hypothetical protein Fleli_1527 [Bernardetia litoralis DSM 6794]|uniref:pEK499-p136 HEPN domain-containing protein n=1 Tax=Bernardetia litoralis (strain ATCC 23117 / DSM 6794 / NBRC 15988 / NCIMB 1366 / Fx l1 / Sio-4) TaxID=880071 RepID=I4AJ14_BERLS|nr:HEPN family nuclease [Bernardetia litoralis]AFM03949.1 hypothetical protein Fleli_1527 [Bernardetia litoralis DSM 6794]
MPKLTNWTPEETEIALRLQRAFFNSFSRFLEDIENDYDNRNMRYYLQEIADIQKEEEYTEHLLHSCVILPKLLAWTLLREQDAWKNIIPNKNDTVYSKDWKINESCSINFANEKNKNLVELFSRIRNSIVHYRFKLDSEVENITFEDYRTDGSNKIIMKLNLLYFNNEMLFPHIMKVEKWIIENNEQETQIGDYFGVIQTLYAYGEWLQVLLYNCNDDEFTLEDFKNKLDKKGFKGKEEFLKYNTGALYSLLFHISSMYELGEANDSVITKAGIKMKDICTEYPNKIIKPVTCEEFDELSLVTFLRRIRNATLHGNFEFEQLEDNSIIYSFSSNGKSYAFKMLFVMDLEKIITNIIKDE